MSRTSQSLRINDIYTTMQIDAGDPAFYLINDVQSYATAIGNHPITPSELPRFSSEPSGHCHSRRNIQGDSGQTSSRPNTFPGQTSAIVTPKNDLEICLDVHEYKVGELKVKCVDDFIIIEGEHPERRDHASLISQQFTRKYKIPYDIDKGKIVCSLSSDAFLYIFAPNIIKERKIPIITVNKPSRSKLGNAKVLKRKFLQGMGDKSLKRQTPQDSTKTEMVKGSVLPQLVEVPEIMKQDKPEQSTN